MAASRSLSILLRSDRHCRLADDLMREFTKQHRTIVSRPSLSVLPSLPVTDWCVYLANGPGDADFPFALSGFVERGTLWKKFIAIHDRTRHRLLRPPKPPQGTHLIHVFCDAALLQGSEAGDIEATHSSEFSANVASRICGWMLADDEQQQQQQRSRLRSGAFINVTDLGGGRVASGIMFGGTKSPLGAIG